MYAWEEFNIKASYDDKITVQVLDKDMFYYTVKYKEEIFKAPLNSIKIYKKR